MEDENEEVFQVLNDIAVYNYIQNVQLLQILENIQQEKRKYKVHKRIDPFQIYDDDEFRRRYRLSKAIARKLYDLLDGKNTLEPMVCLKLFSPFDFTS